MSTNIFIQKSMMKHPCFLSTRRTLQKHLIIETILACTFRTSSSCGFIPTLFCVCFVCVANKELRELRTQSAFPLWKRMERMEKKKKTKQTRVFSNCLLDFSHICNRGKDWHKSSLLASGTPLVFLYGVHQSDWHAEPSFPSESVPMLCFHIHMHPQVLPSSACTKKIKSTT